MADEQIIIDGEKLTKAGFINKFSFKFTNADLFERERICSKFFDIIQRKEQECDELTSKCSQLEEVPRKIRNIILKFAKQDILTFPDLKPEDNYAIIQNQCLDPIRQIIKFLDEMENKNA